METTERDEGTGLTLLFVCTGNTCRSPLAEVLARKHVGERGLGDRVTIRSAGVAAYPGAPASEGSAVVASRHGLDLSHHRSSPLTAELAAAADVILGMTPGHVMGARQAAPDARVELLGSYAQGLEELEGPSVPDPIGAPLDVYEETYAVLDELVGQAVDRIARSLQNA